MTISHATPSLPRNPGWTSASEVAPDVLLEFTSELDLDAPEPVERSVVVRVELDAIEEFAALPVLPPRPRRAPRSNGWPVRSRLTTEWRAQHPGPPALAAWAAVTSAARRSVTGPLRAATRGVSRAALPVSFVCGLVLGGVAVSLVTGRADGPPAASNLAASTAAPRRAATASPAPDLAVGRAGLRLESASATGRAAASLPPAPRVTPAAGAAGDDREDRPAAARPAVYRGSLMLDSRPRGARVFMNDRDMGVTPLDLRNLTVGSRAVRIELDGYQSWSSAVQVSTNQRASITATLSPISPPAAAVRFDLDGTDARVPLPFIDVSRP